MIINKKSMLHCPLILIFTILYILNALAVYNKGIGILIGTIEIAVLVICFLIKDIEHFILLFTLFCSTSLEMQTFVLGYTNNTLYNFYNLPFLRGYHVYLLLLLPLINLLLHGHFSISKLRRYIKLHCFSMGFLCIISISIGVGLLTIICNDNHVAESQGVWTFFRREALRYVNLCIYIFCIVELLIQKKEFYKKLQTWLISILFSLFPAALFCLIFQIWGYYGNIKVFPLSILLSFGIFLMLFPFYRQSGRGRWWFFGGGVILTLLNLSIPSVVGGKWWIVVLLLPLIMIFVYFQNVNRAKMLLLFLACIFVTSVIVIIVWVGIGSWKAQETVSINWFTQYKLESAKNTLMFWKENWVMNLPNSPKQRLDEFINILIEYLTKPQYLLFGKGLGGSIQHHLSLTAWNDLNAFSHYEITNGTYFTMHETINSVFLKFGLIGLTFIGKTLIDCFKGFKNNIWVVIGSVWMIFYIGAYYSLIYGLASLVLGLYLFDKNKGCRKDNVN